MIEDVPYRPCVRSGMCCKIAPCPFGTWDEKKHQCSFLEVDEKHGEIELHRCSKYKEILAAGPEKHADFSPAFGAGCCSPLGNDARNNIITAVNERRISLTIVDSRGNAVRVPV